jgi:hypothetical protein
MIGHWQTWLAALLCLAAAVYIARRAWLAFSGKKTAGCGSGCKSCPDNASQPQGNVLLSIQPHSRKENH